MTVKHHDFEFSLYFYDSGLLEELTEKNIFYVHLSASLFIREFNQTYFTHFSRILHVRHFRYRHMFKHFCVRDGN